MKTFITRSVSGFFYAGIIIGAIFAGPLTFGVIMLLFLVIGLTELGKIARKREISISVFSHYVIPISIYITVLLIFNKFLPWQYSGICIGLLFITLISELFRNSDKTFENIAINLLGIIYLVLPLLMLSMLFYRDFNQQEQTVIILLALFFITWANDTFAYITGSLLGKNKLFERLSPKKTWEGSFGGLLFSLLFAYIFSLFFDEFTLIEWLLFSVIIVVFGTFGDLFESMLKRYANIKESGNVMPGHGGILDRIDSILFVAPFIFIYIYFILN